MDEPLIGWSLLIFIWLYQHLTMKIKCIRNKFDLLKGWSWIPQWYTLFYVVIAYLVARTLYDFVVFEYIHLSFLDTGKVLNNFAFIYNNSTENEAYFKENFPKLKASNGFEASNCGSAKEAYEQGCPLVLYSWLKYASLVAPIFGTVAAGWAAWHVLMWGRYVAQYKAKLLDELPWGGPIADLPRAQKHVEEAEDHVNLVFYIIGMPTFVSLYSMRSLIRSYAVLTGSAWNTFYKVAKANGETVTWKHVVIMERATYETDQGLSKCFQFLIVFHFARLCSKMFETSKYLKQIKDEESNDNSQPSVTDLYKTTLKFAALQGIYGYVVVGAAMALTQFFCSFFGEFEQVPEFKQWADLAKQAAIVQERVLKVAGPCFTLVTILCVINMFLIGKMRELTDRLGNATAKFLGVRVLLLVGQVQVQVLGTLSNQNKLDDITQKLVDRGYISEVTRNGIVFTEDHANLLNATLLCVECLLIVVFNRISWGVGKEKLEEFMDKDLIIDDKKKPLLEAGQKWSKEGRQVFDMSTPRVEQEGRRQPSISAPNI